MFLTLTDSLVRNTTGFPTIVKVSSDGKLAYAVYEITANVLGPITLAAELFEIQNGQLKSIATYNVPIVDNTIAFTNVDSGDANSDFTKFSLVSDNGDDTMQVLILERDGAVLNVLVSATITIYASGYTALGGIFVNNDSHVVVSAVVDNTLPNQTSQLWLLDSENLVEADSLKEVVGIFPVSPVVLPSDKQNLFVTSLSQGVLDFDGLADNWKPPHLLQVYSVDGNKFKLLDSKNLPQGVLGLYSVVDDKCEKGWKIAVGTSTAVSDNEPTIVIPNNSNKSALRDDCELRVYTYSNSKQKGLSLVFSKNTDSPVEGVALASTFDALFFSQLHGEPGKSDQSFFQYGIICDCDLRKLSVAHPVTSQVNFSLDANDKYLLLGSSNTYPSEAEAQYNNILLFKVTKEKKE